MVPADYVAKHNPQADGYFVQYEDGYKSYSPAQAFENGYHRIPELGIACGSTADAAPANTRFKWRKKPVVIEAFQWTGDKDQLGEPQWIVDAIKANDVFLDSEGLNIATLEGVLTASRGDWIIRGVKGELYPCKPDIFAATYDPVGVQDEINRRAVNALNAITGDGIDLSAADFSDALMWLKEGKRTSRRLERQASICCTGDSWIL